MKKNYVIPNCHWAVACISLCVAYSPNSWATCVTDGFGNTSGNCLELSWQMGDISNSYTIQSTQPTYSSVGAVTTQGGGLGSFSNTASGVIDGGAGVGIIIYNPISAINNSGTITASGTISSGSDHGIFNYNTSIGQVDNSGTISSLSRSGIFNYYYANIGAVNNSGVINGINSVAYENYNFGTVAHINNSSTGTISAGIIAIGNHLNSTIGEIANAGTISGNFAAIYNSNDGQSGLSTIATINNSGLISGADKAIYNDSTGAIGSIVNTGRITGANVAIYNAGVITSLSNSQGAGSIGGGLTYTGILPDQYNVILGSDSTTYGKLIASSVSGQLVFGIGGGAVSSASYLGVLQGITEANILSGFTGSYSGYSYRLALHSGQTTVWDLLFAPLAPSMSDITTGSGNLKSAIGVSLTAKLDGGVLTVDNTLTDSHNFTITSRNGTLDQQGLRSVFSGNFSNDSSAAGRLIIINTGNAGQGAIQLSGTNTHSGGTEVQAGAVLSIASPSALGSGGLDLVGSATTPATLETTQTMTISAPITVTGDPVFSVAPTTMLTISSAITGTGDVVVDGGGTLNLIEANAYTGPTTINAGSTLALTGNNAAITTSSAVTNNGTFDLRGGNPTSVTVNDYTQGSTGSLRLVAAAPGTFQKLSVTGNATLSGTLDLTAAAGNYAIGRYVLVDASGSRSGTFSSFNNNLAIVTPLGFRLGYNANQAYLDLTPASGATQQQINQNALGLRSLINTQNAALQAGLSYDCEVFDSNNLCVSAGGRYTYAGEGAVSNLGGMLTLAYRPTASTRIGVFADQSLDNVGTGTVSQSKSQPTFGMFANWARNADGRGLNVHASAVVSSSDLTIKRQSSAVTEGAQGKTSFNGQAYELRVSYVEPLSNTLTATPYVGLRYSHLAMGSYSEAGNAMNWPVSYRGMAQEALSLVAGTNLSLRVMDKLSAYVGLGVQQNLHYRMGEYAGTSDIPGVATFSMPMAGKSNTLAMAKVGTGYEISKTERLGINAQWQQQPSFSRGTSSVMANWTVGF